MAGVGTIKLDVSDSHFHIPIHMAIRKCPVLSEINGNIFQFLVLHFSQVVTPNGFTWVWRQFYLINISCLLRLILIQMTLRWRSLSSHTRFFINYLLEDLGFSISWKKSESFPFQSFLFLGTLLNISRPDLSHIVKPFVFV